MLTCSSEWILHIHVLILPRWLRRRSQRFFQFSTVSGVLFVLPEAQGFNQYKYAFLPQMKHYVISSVVTMTEIKSTDIYIRN